MVSKVDEDSPIVGGSADKLKLVLNCLEARDSVEEFSKLLMEDETLEAWRKLADSKEQDLGVGMKDGVGCIEPTSYYDCVA